MLFPINPINIPQAPTTSVQPFTYKDGVTYLERLELLVRYINKYLVTTVNENYDDLAETFETEVNQLIEAVNSAIEAVVNNSIELQDEVMAAIVNDAISLTRVALNNIYAKNVDVDAIEAELTSRLSDATLDARYSKYRRVIKYEDYGAIGDGVTDDYIAINAALSSANNNDIVVGSGTYAISQPVSLNEKNSVTVSGGTFIFTHTASANKSATAFYLSNCNNCRIENLVIKQSDDTQDKQYLGMTVRGSDSVIVDNVIIYNFRWIGLGAINSSTNITFNNCQGIRCYVGGFTDITTSNIKFVGGRYSSEWPETQEYIDKEGVWDTSSKYYDGIIISGSDWIIDGVTLDNNGQSGIFGDGGNSRGLIVNCIVKNNFNKGIDFGKTNEFAIDSLIFANNTISDNDTGDIHLSIATNCIITGNIIHTSGTNGIILNGVSNGNTIADNLIKSVVAGSPAIFADAAAINNSFVNNVIGATIPYAINGSATNIVEFANGGTKRVQALLEVDRSNETGFPGRALANFVASSDNEYIQIMGNAPIYFQHPLGSFQDIRAKLATFESVFISPTGFLSLPQTAQTAEGTMWYDTTTHTVKYRDNVGVKTVNAT